MPEIVDAELVDDPTNETEIAKYAGSIPRMGIKLLATTSVRFVVSSAIATLVPVETKKEKRKVFIASMVISGAINEHVKSYVDTEIDEAINFCHEVIKHVTKIQTESDNTDVPNT